MAETAIKKFINYFWGETEDAEEGYEENAESTVYPYEYQEEEENGGETLGIFKRKNKVVQMPQTQQIKMKIAKPTSFEQAEEIVNQLKGKNAIVFNLEYVSKEVARRIIDFVSGAVVALDAKIEKVSNSIIVVAPFNYDIVNDVNKEKIENKFTASWIK